MAEIEIRFDDGASYERMMGTWSRIAGNVFLDWLAVPPGLSWVDIGCGNGAFTELIVDRCAPGAVEGIDPSEGQLSFARSRPAARLAKFTQGDAQALPFAAKSFDVATMALVIFFVPDPARGVAEMVRVVRPGGLVATYAWDILAGGFPSEPVNAELRAIGITPPLAPRLDVVRMDAMRALWTDAGLENVETREIAVERTFSDFEDFWTITALSSSMRPTLAKMTSGDIERVKTRVREKLAPDSSGRITCRAWANAAKGRVPK
jgi:ubiquinone/menaquinone biosynthesis C-methylase UbiE